MTLRCVLNPVVLFVVVFQSSPLCLPLSPCFFFSVSNRCANIKFDNVRFEAYQFTPKAT
jgi:hypothetical protein